MNFRFAALLLPSVVLGAHALRAQAPPVGETQTPPTVAAPNGGTPAKPSAEPSPKSSGGVREAKPDVYFVKDKNGELVPLVGFSLEQFERMLREDSAVGRPVERPPYRLDGIEAVGRIDGRNARVELVFSIAVDTAGWVRIPLGLKGTVLEKQAAFAGSGKFTLEFDAKTGEYAVWIDSKADQTHKLTLRTATALEQIAGSTTLRLHLPRAWTSTLSLEVPEKSVEVELSAAAVLDAVDVKSDTSTIRVTGIGGDFAVTWNKTDSASRRAPTLLEANADVAATIDGHSVAYQTQITVNSFGGEFDRFRIRLPPSAVLLHNESLDIVLQKLPAQKNAKSETYEVRRIAGPAKSFSVRLQAVRPIEPTKGQQAFDLGGIEVLDAVRQWGYLGVRVVGDWQVLWGERTQIRQVDASPELFRGQSMAAVFEYFGRTFTLTTRIVPRETRVTVDPAYAVDVTSRRAYLQANLGYRVGGAKIFTLDADFFDWQIDEVGPPELVDTAAIVVGKSGVLSIPLLQPSTGEFTLVVRAHRDLPNDAKTLELKVPRPTAGVVGPAAWSVRSAENVELSPRDAASTGLLRQTRGENRSFASERPSWNYSTDAADAKFLADYRVLSRTVRVSSSTHVDLGEQGRVVQKLAYDVAREPIDALEFDVAARLTDRSDLEIRVGEATLPWVVVSENADDAAKPVRIRISLPQAKVGEFEVTAAYPMTVERPDFPAGVPASVAMLSPIDGEQIENVLQIAAAPGLYVQHVDEVWSPDAPTGKKPAANEVVFRTTSQTTEAVLGLRWEEVDRVRPVHLERIWIQSVWLGAGRWERAVLRLSTAAGSATVRLPPQVTGLVAYVDGARAEVNEKLNAGSVTLRLHPEAGTTHVLDLRYQTNESLDEGSLLAPNVEGAVSHGQIYRQLVLPGDRVLWTTSAGYAGEFEWRRTGLVWGRSPRMSQADLERWSGARTEPPVPEQAAVYLVGGFGDVPPLTIRAVRRSTIVLASSAVMLAAALGLLYVPRARSVGVVAATSIGVLAIGLIYPDVAPIAVQAALFGIVPSILALLIERNVARRRGRAVRGGEGVSASHRSATRTRIAPTAPLSPPASTATVDLGSPSLGSGGAT